jgi:mandelate racemase
MNEKKMEMNKQAPRIKEIRVRAVQVPMREPHRTASGTIVTSPLVLTDVVTDTGVVGHSYVFCYADLALKPTALLTENLAPLLIGESLAPQAIYQRLQQKFRLLGPQGLTGIAMAALDMALWDALARSQNLPLVRLLGGEAKPIPAYGAVGYDGVDDSAQKAAAWVQQGFKGVKAKIGYPTVEEDLAVVRAMREAMGPQAALMVDYNQSLTPTEAIERGRRLEAEGLAWIEEPVLAHDYAGHARVAQELATPIQCGENWWGPQDLRKAIDSAACDLMMPDVMKIGGVSGWLQVAALANAFSIRLSNHLFVEVSTHLLCATPTAHWLEYADWFNPILQQPLAIEQGYAILDDRPGSGIEWNEEAVARYLVA